MMFYNALLYIFSWGNLGPADMDVFAVGFQSCPSRLKLWGDNLPSAGTLLLTAVLCKRPGPKTFAWQNFRFQTCHLCSEDDRPEAECRTRMVV